MATLTLDEAQRLVAATLERCRTSPKNAEAVAIALVRAEADGLKSHGLLRLPQYAAQAKAGKVDGFATVIVETARPGAARIDAADGFAYPALDQAIAILPGMAQLNGIAAAAIRRSHHCGVAGHTVERLAKEGLVALMFANTPAAMAPWGGRNPVFGTNPIAFACPLSGREPIVIDLSLSKVARGNLLRAVQKGEPIPEGWALDAEGEPTTDPWAALAGTMVPLGDAKGTALALMVELFAAGLTGANYAAEASSFFSDAGPPPGTGQFLIAVDGAAFGASVERFGVLADAIESQEGARLPGARRFARRNTAELEGLSVPEELLTEIRRL
jgi:(2R)-3-sulfolactate dehydrogenase (NADP+)